VPQKDITTRKAVLRFSTEHEGEIGNTSFGKRGTGGAKRHIRGKSGEHLMKYNFKKLASFGLALRWGRMGNEMVGQFTGQRMRQQQRQGFITAVQYGIGVKVAGPFGLIYAGADIGYRALNHYNQMRVRNNKADILREKSGLNARKRSRREGRKI